MIIKTKPAETIRAAYHLRRSKSKKCREDCTYDEVWRILSDQIRILLSAYVKMTNARSGRRGGKVKGNYERYIFENVAEAERMKETLSNQRYNLSQELKRYRPSKKVFRIKNKQLRHSIYMSCARLSCIGKVRELGLKCLNLAGMGIYVLRHLVKSTFDHHFPPNSLIYHSIDLQT